MKDKALAPMGQAIGDLSADQVKAEIHRRHEAAAAFARDALGCAIRCGELLQQVKDQVGHGKWLPWLEANCEFSERTAQVYLKLAAEQQKIAATADLTISGALKQIANGKEKITPARRAEAKRNFGIVVRYIDLVGDEAMKAKIERIAVLMAPHWN